MNGIVVVLRSGKLLLFEEADSFKHVLEMVYIYKEPPAEVHRLDKQVAAVPVSAIDAVYSAKEQVKILPCR